MTRFGTAALLGVVACIPLFPQIPAEVDLSIVAGNMRFPAGLTWSREGFLIIADSGKREIYRVDPKQRPKPTHQDTNGVQGIAYDSAGRLYLCETATRKLVRMDRRGKMETIAAAFEGKKFNGPSEVVVRHDGNVYFTDPAFAGAIDRRELDFNGVFHVKSNGDVEALARWKTRPNGLALSADGKKLFVSDADRHAIVQFDLDSRGGATASRDFITGVHGVPAGLRLDTTGQLFVGAEGLAIYSPEGKLIRTLVESRRVLNCAFGGADLNLLYIATPKEIVEVKIGVKGALQY
ncbi:MAG TPA: SMP-30/gluconolactonase/LRE family protein [Bryobacteraceae bacterium]|nr:SMP-30/gluconolactonase/LRE family protein [Bryobacteraceae bacterium]